MTAGSDDEIVEEETVVENVAMEQKETTYIDDVDNIIGEVIAATAQLISGVQEVEQYKANLPQIAATDKGKEPLVVYALVHFEAVDAFFNSFSIRRLPALGSLEAIAAKEEKILTWGEIYSVQTALQRRVYIIAKQNYVVSGTRHPCCHQLVPNHASITTQRLVTPINSNGDVLGIPRIKAKRCCVASTTESDLSQTQPLICASIISSQYRKILALALRQRFIICSRQFAQRTRFHQNGSVSLPIARESDLYRNFTNSPSNLNQISPNDGVYSLMLLKHAANNPTPSDYRFLLLLRSLTNPIVNSTFQKLPELLQMAKILVDGSWLIVEEVDFWRPITRPVDSCNWELLPQRPYIYDLAPLCAFIEPVQEIDSRAPFSKLVRDLWAEVCVAIVQFSLIGCLSSVSTINQCRDIFGPLVDIEEITTGFRGLFQNGLSTNSFVPFFNDFVEQPKEQVLPEAESFSSDDSTVYRSPSQDAAPSSPSTDSSMHFDTDDIPLGTETAVEQILLSNTVDPATDLFEQFAQIRAFISQLSIKHLRTQSNIGNLQNHLLLRIDDLEKYSANAHTQIPSRDLSKEFDDKLAVIRNDLLEFRMETQGQYATLSANLAELIAFVTKGRDDKKGEVGSSHG
ncbi:protein SHOOT GRAVITROPISM 6 [Dorcoceras hygrometricum]|uniref:Protein SHOOT GRAVITROPISM 6 n=1 Tax=Dorcoceras hygrometricum TaxID=472368 RepID=A0A2Z7AXH9_9LAMI|nr:protein SHOOT GRAVITROPISM 6 [Dorcoceras hygrometricum]